MIHARGESAVRGGGGSNTILAIECCPHIVKALKKGLDKELRSVTSRQALSRATHENGIKLIVIGAATTPVRRPFISQLRRICADTPLLIFRRERYGEDDEKERLRGEFVLSDASKPGDLKLVGDVSRLLPLKPCTHLDRPGAFAKVREIVKVIADRYHDPLLDLKSAATELGMSPARLSRILNIEANISFPQLLRQVRVEEAKRLLSTTKYSVKEVSARVGFSDSHYFSRVFKQATGMNPTEFEQAKQSSVFG